MLMPDDFAGGGGSGGGGADTKDEFDSAGAIDQIGADLFPKASSTEPSRTYDRDDRGQFAKKVEPKDSKEPDASAKPVQGKVTPGTDNKVTQTTQPALGTDPNAPAPAPTSTTAAAATDPNAPQALQPPKTWTKDALPFWSQTPPRVQAEILKREADMFRGLQQYREAAQVGQTFAKTLEPFVPAMQKFQLNPSDILKRALTAHLNLTLSPPEVKMRLFRGLAQDYGIDLEALMDDVPYEQPQVSQETLALQQEVAQLRQALGGLQQSHLDQRKTAVLADVNAFADNPENIYFEELADDITQLLHQGVATDLKDAYEKAIWLNPVVREKEVARQAAARQTKATTDEATRIAEAKKATATNVRTQPRPASAKDDSSTGSMEDTIAEQMRSIRSRG